MIPRPIQHQLLTALHDVFARWANTFSFACHKGCATCCTRSVTMTSLEGETIIAFLIEKNRRGELDDPAFQPEPAPLAQCTTNTFVAAHLRGESVDEPENWDLRPCPFLAKESCTIYPVRPFGCRLFASLAPCSACGVAEMPPGYLAGATAMLQCIEHLDSGGRWGVMTDLLAGLNSGRIDSHGQAAFPLPGFLIAPDEQSVVEPLLRDLLDHPVHGHSFAQWLEEAAQP